MFGCITITVRLLSLETVPSGEWYCLVALFALFEEVFLVLRDGRWETNTFWFAGSAPLLPLDLFLTLVKMLLSLPMPVGDGYAAVGTLVLALFASIYWTCSLPRLIYEVFRDATLSYLGWTFKFPGLNEKTLIFSRCLMELCSVAISMSLLTVYFVELCLAEVGLLHKSPWWWNFWPCDEPPDPFEFACCGEDEFIILLCVVVEMVKVDGFEMAIGLLLDIFTGWWWPWFCLSKVGACAPDTGWLGCWLLGETLQLPPIRICLSLPASTFYILVLLLWLARNEPWNLPR